MGENIRIRDALGLKYYSALKLKHRTYGYLNVLPRQYITYLKQNHCSLDAQAIKELKLKAHYTRPWDRSNNERLEAFPQ